MEYDLLEYIFEKLKETETKVTSILKFRLLNKNSNEIFQDYFKQIKVDLISRYTFIKMNECFVCDNVISTSNTSNTSSNLKQLVYKYDSPPHKCIMHCNNYHCHLSAVKRYLIDIKNNHIYPFCKETNKFIMDNYDVLVDNKETYNEKTISSEIETFYIETLRKYRNKWYIKIQYCMIFEKYFQLNNMENIINYNLFGWFLNRRIK